jgi:hypothetical protein
MGQREAQSRVAKQQQVLKNSWTAAKSGIKMANGEKPPISAGPVSRVGTTRLLIEGKIKMTGFRKLSTMTSAAALATALFAADARAVTVYSVGDSFTVNFSYETLAADLVWTVTNIVGNRWSFNVMADNDSPNSLWTLFTSNRITAFGFATESSISNLRVNGWDMLDWGASIITAGDLTYGCVYDGPSCQSFTYDGVSGGARDAVDFSFSYGSDGPLTFTSFATQWQGTSVTDPNNPRGTATSIVLASATAPVPLPAAGMLLLGALGGLALMARRKTAGAALAA